MTKPQSQEPHPLDAPGWRLECPHCHRFAVVLDQDMRLLRTEGTYDQTEYCP